MATKDEIFKKISNACVSLYKNQMYLIEEHANERTVAAHIAAYLRELFIEWDVDSEYNREGELRVPKRDIEGELAYPDIIIHRHGFEGPNLVAMEIKGYWNKTNRNDDVQKLLKLQSKHGYMW